MFKKWIALLLAVALLCSVVPQVSAARIENRIALGRYAFTDDDHVYREFTNSGTVRLTMVPGEWLVTPAFHAVDGWIASYSGFNTVSSDPEIAEARIVYVGASPVSGIANSFIGLEVHAKKPGTAEITVSYSTFVTNSQYEDARSTPHSQKTFTVTVTDQALEMDVAMSTSGVSWDWPAGYRDAVDYYNKNMAKANEMLAAKLLSDGLTAVITGGTMALGYGAAATLGVTMFVPGGALVLVTTALGLAVGLGVRTQMGLAKGNSNAVKEAADAAAADVRNMLIDESINYAKSFDKVNIPLGALIDAAELGYTISDANLNSLLRANTYPTATPAELSVLIRLTNNSSRDITAVLDLSSENLSFTSEYGPWADSSTAGNTAILVPGNGSVPVKVKVYAKPGFHGVDSGISQLIHTGTVAVQCRYYDEGLGQEVTLDGGAELPVYSKLNKQDQAKAAEALLQQENRRGAYVMCPVDVHILDKTGKTLGVLTSGGEDYQDEFITAGAFNDMKYIMIPQEKKADYQLKIVAVEDGTMHVLGVDGSAATNLSAYADVPLKKGDTFFLDLSESEPATLYTLDTEGNREPVEAVLRINEEAIAAELEKTDISEENRGTVAHAMAHALVPAGVQMESYRTAVTLEQLAQLMLNLCEKQLDLFPGKLTQLYLAENPEAEPVSLPVAVAAWKGLLSRDYTDAAFQKDASSRLLTMEEMQMMHDSFCDMMQLPEAVDFTRDSLTLEQVICMVDDLWKAKAVEGKNAELVRQLTEEVRSKLSENDYYDDYPVYYSPDEKLEAAFRDMMIYEPVSMSATVPFTLMNSDLMSKLRTLMRLSYYNMGSSALVDMDILRQSGMSVAFGRLGGAQEVTDTQDWYYSWAPFYLTQQYGSIYGNTVYLVVYRGYKAADHSVYGQQADQDKRDNRIECYIITDQETVGSFLANQYLLNQTVAAKYTELSSGSKGEDVRMLQLRLISAGYLEGEASGEYDEQTGQAVREMQAQLQRNPTGVADVELQRILAGEITIRDFPLENWLKPYVEKAKQENPVP